MQGRCCAKCGSSFHLRPNEICSGGKQPKGNKNEFLQTHSSKGMISVLFFFNLSPIHRSVYFYVYGAGLCNTPSPLCIFLCFTSHSGLRAFLPHHTHHSLCLFFSSDCTVIQNVTSWLRAASPTTGQSIFLKKGMQLFIYTCCFCIQQPSPSLLHHRLC